MIKTKTLIIGGGASGLFCAVMLRGADVIVLERGDRVGKKLSATGNGQGNVTNSSVAPTHYFTVQGDKGGVIEKTLGSNPNGELIRFLEQLGGCFLADSRGRVYPSGKQASAITDLLRYKLQAEGKRVITKSYVTSITKSGGAYRVEAQEESGKQIYLAQNVVVCTGGKASKSFGTDGNGYGLLAPLNHTVTKLYPSLVQIKTQEKDVKPLKGIRVNCKIQAKCGGKVIASEQGDVIFADYGVSGDAVFRLSAFIAAKIEDGVLLSLDLLPEVSENRLIEIIKNKQKTTAFPEGELLCGILNNQVGRVVMKRAASLDAGAIAGVIKGFTLSACGSLGYDYAQVTKGGIPLCEVTDGLESKGNKGLYIAGEILDVDGQCGGYNLQWAYSSAKVIATEINGK